MVPGLLFCLGPPPPSPPRLRGRLPGPFPGLLPGPLTGLLELAPVAFDLALKHLGPRPVAPTLPRAPGVPRLP